MNIRLEMIYDCRQLENISQIIPRCDTEIGIISNFKGNEFETFRNNLIIKKKKGSPLLNVFYVIANHSVAISRLLHFTRNDTIVF